MRHAALSLRGVVAQKHQHKIISFYAKKARGMMSRFVISERVSKPEDLRGFDEGYRFSKEQSSGSTLVFLRDEADQ